VKNRNPPLATDIRFNARELRQRETEAEAKLWEHIRDRQLDRFKFRRQHPKGRQILDFYCHDAKLAVELDGWIHDEEKQQSKDNFRTALLEETGVTVIRFKNHDVMNNISDVLNKIRTILTTLSQRERVAETDIDSGVNPCARGEGKNYNRDTQ